MLVFGVEEIREEMWRDGRRWVSWLKLCKAWDRWWQLESGKGWSFICSCVLLYRSQTRMEWGRRLRNRGVLKQNSFVSQAWSLMKVENRYLGILVPLGTGKAEWWALAGWREAVSPPSFMCLIRLSEENEMQGVAKCFGSFYLRFLKIFETHPLDSVLAV